MDETTVLFRPFGEVVLTVSKYQLLAVAICFSVIMWLSAL
jgi:hypothetical protein